MTRARLERLLGPAASVLALGALVAVLASPWLGTGEAAVVDLAGSWRFRPGDDLAWAAPDLRDDDWAVLRVPGSWGRQGYPAVYGLAWYRLRVAAGELAGRPLAVSLGMIDSAYEVFAGGAKLGGVGGMPPTPRLEYDRRATYPIPLDGLAADGSLVLAIRVWRAPGKAPGAAGPVAGPFLLGPWVELERRAAVVEAPELAIVVAFFLAGLRHLGVWRRRPTAHGDLWFGIMAIEAAFYCFLRTQWKYELGVDFLVLKKLEHLLLYLVPITLPTFLWPMLDRVPGLAVRAYRAALAVAAVAVVISPGLDLALALLPWVQLVFFVFAAGVMGLVARGAWVGHPEARNLAPGIAVLVLALAHDALVDRGFLVHPRLGLFGFAALLAGMSSSLTHRFHRAVADLDDLRRRLESLVDERTAQLAAALVDLEHVAGHDTLTGLLKRRALDERLHEEWARASRDGSSVAVVLADVDRFKSINDELGHAAGDQALQAIARALEGELRPYDHLGRWGGEELLLVLPGLDEEAAALAAERLRGAVAAQRIEAGPQARRLSASFGVAVARPATAAETIQATIARADAALYQAKRDGRDAVRVG